MGRTGGIGEMGGIGELHEYEILVTRACEKDDD